MMRLQKFLAHAGICSRRKAEEHILNGQVKVNQKVVTQLGTQIDPEKDEVVFQGKPVAIKQEPVFTYIALNKPKGVVSSCSQKNVKIVIDLVDTKERVYPVGRLDKDSQGLLLLTNDGNLHHRLSHPSFDHEKEYIVKTRSPLSDRDLNTMSKGMVIDGKKTRPARVKRLAGNTFNIVLKQGLNRQIRKMVETLGNHVTSLTRVRMAHIRLHGLKPGQWRYLSQSEIRKLTQ